LQRYLTMDEQVAMGWFKPDGSLADIFKTPEQGAATSIWCAVSPLLEGKGGVYCEDCNIAAAWHDGLPRYSGVRDYATDPQSAARLWALSEELTGLTF
jgi:hypothetical protein